MTAPVPLDFDVHVFDSAFAEVQKQSDRGAALIAASMLEDEILTAIKARFSNRDDKVEGEFLKGYGPLATFKSRIDVAFLLGIYSLEVRRILISISKIRNMFAHKTEPLNFNSKAILDHLANVPDLSKIKTAWKNFHTQFGSLSPLDKVFSYAELFSDEKSPRDKFVLYIQNRMLLTRISQLGPLASAFFANHP